MILLKKATKNKYIIFSILGILALIVIFILTNTRSKDVTNSWAKNDVILTQRNFEINTTYQLIFSDSSLIISDIYVPISPDSPVSESEVLPLEVGEYSSYTVTEKDDIYTIKYGDNLSYQLTQTSPRIFIDEIGTEYKTDSYIDEF